MAKHNYKYIIFISIICAYFLFIRETSLSKDKQIFEKESPEKSLDTNEVFHKRRKSWKKILIWTEFFHSKNVWHSIFKRLSSGECEESRCSISLDKKEISTSDAVLFNAFNLRDVKRSPSYLKGHVFPFPNERDRSPHQIYIFYSMESPQKCDKAFIGKIPRGFFNWTMGYRRDSDIYEPFGIVRKKSTYNSAQNTQIVTQEELKKKKFAIWLASSCYKNAPFLREKFIETFRRLTPVDIYGKCGKVCDDYMGLNIYGDISGTSPCERHVKNYVFYLALENSICDDYVTEKIFKAWNLGVIPVVFGGANYSSFTPPMSYIDFRDFKSLSELIKYMKKVASDHKLYNQYFKWKEDYDIEIGSPYNPFVCDLCQKLHEQTTSRSRKSYENIHNWFVSKSNCKGSLDRIIQLN